MHTLAAVAIRVGLAFQRSITAPHRQNTAPKSQPPNPGREIFRPRVEETTGKNVSAAKKIARYAEKVSEIRAKSDSTKMVFKSNINYLIAGWGARIRTWDCRGKLCI
jgi:hypothetical protein